MTGPNPLRRAMGRLLPDRLRRTIAERLMRSNVRTPVLPPGIAAVLRQRFTDDITRVESLLDRDLSGWKHTGA